MLHTKKQEGLVCDVRADTSRINDRGQIWLGAGHTTAFCLIPLTYDRVVYHCPSLANLVEFTISWLARTVHCVLVLTIHSSICYAYTLMRVARSIWIKNIVTEQRKLPK